jgi:hypothetical protein
MCWRTKDNASMVGETAATGPAAHSHLLVVALLELLQQSQPLYAGACAVSGCGRGASRGRSRSGRRRPGQQLQQPRDQGHDALLLRRHRVRPVQLLSMRQACEPCECSGLRRQARERMSPKWPPNKGAHRRCTSPNAPLPMNAGKTPFSPPASTSRRALGGECATAKESTRSAPCRAKPASCTTRSMSSKPSADRKRSWLSGSSCAGDGRGQGRGLCEGASEGVRRSLGRRRQAETAVYSAHQCSAERVEDVLDAFLLLGALGRPLLILVEHL